MPHTRLKSMLISYMAVDEEKAGPTFAGEDCFVILHLALGQDVLPVTWVSPWRSAVHIFGAIRMTRSTSSDCTEPQAHLKDGLDVGILQKSPCGLKTTAFKTNVVALQP